MDRRSFIAGSASIAAAAQISPLLAQDAPVEFSFFFPVAVGSAITKLIDGYAAAFGKENPDIKVAPARAASNLIVTVAKHRPIMTSIRDHFRGREKTFGNGESTDG